MLQISQLVELARATAHGSSAASLTRASSLRFGSSDPMRVPVVVWNVCQHCNMTCPHCYAAASLRPSPGDLSPREGLDLLDQLAAASLPVVETPVCRSRADHLVPLQEGL